VRLDWRFRDRLGKIGLDWFGIHFATLRPGMLIPRLIPILILGSAVLFGRAEASVAPALDSAAGSAVDPLAMPAQSTKIRHATMGQSDLLLRSRDTSKLDDEVEMPDEEEDDTPDDPGQALDPDDRPAPMTAHTQTPYHGPVALAARPRGFDGEPDGRNCPRCSSLCRLLC
jgi:hypothetical protein